MNKQFLPYGVAVKEFHTADEAISDTYRRYNKEYPPTPLIFAGNPFNDDIKNAKTILEIGCGCGRNVNWIMENTNAQYIGIDPNPHMLRFFQDFVNPDYLSRCHIAEDFSIIDNESVIEDSEAIDVVVSIFVFQHIGYRPPSSVMNVDDITQEIRKYTHDGTIWFLNEHEQEEPGWIAKWLNNNNFIPDVYEEKWTQFPELQDRGDFHRLVIVKEER